MGYGVMFIPVLCLGPLQGVYIGTLRYIMYVYRCVLAYAHTFGGVIRMYVSVHIYSLHVQLHISSKCLYVHTYVSRE